MLTSSVILDLALYVGVISVALYCYFTRHFNYWKEKNVQFIKPLPFVGNFLDGLTLQQSMAGIFDQLYHHDTEPYFGFFVLDKPCLLIRDAEIIKNILTKDFQHFEDRTGANNKAADPISNYVLFMLKNPDWKHVRAKITPTFTSAKIKMMSKLVTESGQDFVNYLTKTTAKNAVIEVKEVCQRFTVEVISSSIFGVKSDCFLQEKSEILHHAQTLFDWNNWWSSFQMRAYFIAPALVQWLKLKLLNPKATTYLKNLFLYIMNKRISTKTFRNDFIDILLELEKDDSNFLKGDVLTAQTIMFFAAGYETSSSTMTFVLYEIAKNQTVQNKLREEIRTISRKYGGITYESLKEMEYLELCIKETLRKYPVLPFLDRRCKSDYQVPNSDLIIEKDIPVFIPLLSLQNDPKYVPNPEKFDPDRFLKTSNQNNECFYLPFGEGPRHCIGERFGMLSVKTGLAHLFERFAITICNETQSTITFQKTGLLLSPLGGIKLKFTKQQ